MSCPQCLAENRIVWLRDVAASGRKKSDFQLFTSGANGLTESCQAYPITSFFPFITKEFQWYPTGCFLWWHVVSGMILKPAPFLAWENCNYSEEELISVMTHVSQGDLLIKSNLRHTGASLLETDFCWVKACLLLYAFHFLLCLSSLLIPSFRFIHFSASFPMFIIAFSSQCSGRQG